MKHDVHDEIRLDLAKSQDEWEGLCAGFPHATAFHRYDFLSAIAPCLHCKFMPFIVSSRGQKVGVAPLLVRKSGPFCIINYVPFPYLGPLVPTAFIQATLGALSMEARRRRALDHYQFFSPFFSAPAIDGFSTHVDRTFIIPLRGRSDEDLLQAMHSGRRKEIRRTERMGLRVYDAESGDFQLMDVWNKKLYAAQGLLPLYPPGTYERVFEALKSRPGSTFYAARMDGRTVGVQINLESSRRVFAWQAGIDGSFKGSSPQSALMWHTALRARDAGASEFDLVGAPSDGIATYKRRLGAEERGYVVMRRPIPSYRLARAAISRTLVGTRKSLWLARASAKSRRGRRLRPHV